MRKSWILVLSFLVSACGTADLGSRCTTAESCSDDAGCQCWCSQKCGFRKKQPNDSPIYIQNDPNGKFCYCKQWDLDFYDENCLNGENVKQPPGAN